MANTLIAGKLKETMQKAYSIVKNAASTHSSQPQVSVGARLQGRQSTEVIITQTAHSMSTMRGLQARHDFTLEIITFDKSYVTAADLSDTLLSFLSIWKETGDSNSDFAFFPKGQVMYFTDEDDFAVGLTVDVTVIDKI